MIEKVAERIYLSRAFPFDMPFEYISVLDKDKKEIGFIRSLDDFDEPARTQLIHELETKYYTPVIKKILSVKERYGFSYWKTECEFGEKSFTLQDTFRSIIKSPKDDGRAHIHPRRRRQPLRDTRRRIARPQELQENRIVS